VYKASTLQRGDLIEVRVKLSASWIFQISTMVTEFSDMFDDSPLLFIEHVQFSDLYQAKNANKIISRLLAGLIPIDGSVSDYVVITHESEEYIVHKEACKNIPLDEVRPLQIVGVTDHLAYWKDIRRILFAENEFTVLCRLAKSGIQKNWNPIKAADIFKDFAPDLAHQIESSSKVAVAQSTVKEIPIDLSLAQLCSALEIYQDLLLDSLPSAASSDMRSDIQKAASEFKLSPYTPEGQRAAFAAVKALIEELTGEDVDAETDLKARERARELSDLPLFPAPAGVRIEVPASPTSVTPAAEPDRGCLLNVEVVAIYW
jgi:hypothetical protein